MKLMNRKRTWTILLSAILATPVISLAQARVDHSHSNDASNRIGSGGLNEPMPGDPAPNMGVSGNQIITGNTTGNKQFRDTVGYTDPKEFRGPVAGQSSEKLNREAAPVDIRQRTTGAPNTSAYYNANRVAAPATLGPDYEHLGAGGAIVPKAPEFIQPNDTRLGVVGRMATPLPRPGELLMPGPVDPTTNQPTVVTASPLYGIKQSRIGDRDDELFLSRYTGLRPETGVDRLGLTDEGIMKAREEVARAAGINPSEDNKTDTAGKSDTNTPGSVPGAIPSGQINTQPLASTTETGQVTKKQILVPAEKQTPQLVELKRRLEQMKADRKMTDEDWERVYQMELRTRKKWEEDRKKKAAGDVAIITPTPKREGVERFGIEDLAARSRELLDGKKEKEQAGGAATLTKNPDGTVVKKPEPVMVTTLTKDISATGLRETLAKAESLTREGKYASALDQFDAAEQIAPNNALIMLGRAHTELGASYFGKAEADIRRAVATDRSLLMGRYDLRAFLGADRVESLVKDLREVMNTEKTQARPALLLAYIAYNTGYERLAADYLDQAEQRGGTDGLITLFRATWSLPEAENK